jgi:hypothetical protein
MKEFEFVLDDGVIRRSNRVLLLQSDADNLVKLPILSTSRSRQGTRLIASAVRSNLPSPRYQELNFLLSLFPLTTMVRELRQSGSVLP